MPVALQARGVSRSFRGFRALDRVDLSVEEGEIHAILGPNGAGKTTLFNCLSGVLQPTEGTVELFGEPITGLPPNQIVRKGLSRSFQISSVFESLTDQLTKLGNRKYFDDSLDKAVAGMREALVA